MKITFCGAARHVTGSCHLIELNSGVRIVLDCGLYQGSDEEMDAFNSTFPFKPSTVDHVILSHAHIDHAGRLPLLVKKGYRGKIHATHASRSLCSIMLVDSAMIQERDAAYTNKRLRKKGKSSKHFVEPLYNKEDVHQTLSQFESHSYDTWFRINDQVSVIFTDAGHILGSASVVLRIQDGGEERYLGFTGDIGRPDRPILRDPQPMIPCDYLICESTYGDRLHKAKPEESTELVDVIMDTCIERKGKLIIPAFSVGRTQEIIYILDQLENEGKLPHLPVYVDSPLAVNATRIFGVHPECYDRDLQKYLLTDPNPFGFNNLHYVTEVEDSKRINHTDEPSIIISSAGMANAGRVVHHIRNNIEDERTTLLMVGYCAPNTTGGILKDGADEIKIFGDRLKVNAQIRTMNSFSAHGDQAEMADFIANHIERNRRVFLVHGDYKAQMTFAGVLVNKGFEQVDVPYLGQQVELN